MYITMGDLFNNAPDLLKQGVAQIKNIGSSSVGSAPEGHITLFLFVTVENLKKIH